MIVVEMFDDVVDGGLYPVEEAVVARAVPARRAEFTTGRACARLALERLGLPAAAIPTDGERRPVWPAGVTGSITHCEGYRAAALGRRPALGGLGIDAEPNLPLSASLRRSILTAAESREVAALDSRHDCWDRAVFSAKESVFKAVTAAGTDVSDFLSVVVRLHPRRLSFSATFPTAGGRGAAFGRIGFTAAFVGTYVEVR